MHTEHDLPPHVAWLGYGGLIPFAALAVLSVTDPISPWDWLQGLLAYGAVILAFVGALHWAFAMLLPTLSAAERRNRYAWSVVPALVGGLACWSASPHATWALVLAFALHYWQDRRLALSAPLPAWYLRLRLHLTLGACASLALAGMGAAGLGAA